MKINEVEKALDITKANIRFYEKEGLLTPGRTESGYREYSEQDVNRLKEIVIYRKLGISIQQIADILDGAVSLQDALDENIKALNQEIEKLNGSLALCQQLKAEDTQKLDIERYWEAIHQQEQLGFQFQSIASDYINFLAPTLSWAYWIPEEAWHKPLRVGKYLLIWSLVYTVLGHLMGGDHWANPIANFLRFLWGIFVWALILLPAYYLSKKNPKLAQTIQVLIPVGLLMAAIGIVIYSLYSASIG